MNAIALFETASPILKMCFFYDNNYLIIGFTNSIAILKQLKPHLTNSYQYCLDWYTNTPWLTAAGLNIEEVEGLSQTDFLLLIELGATNGFKISTEHKDSGEGSKKRPNVPISIYSEKNQMTLFQHSPETKSSTYNKVTKRNDPKKVEDKKDEQFEKKEKCLVM